MTILNPTRWVWTSLVVLLFIATSSLADAQCRQTARTVSQTSVYDRPPTFSSGTGWQLGNRVAALPASAEVKICEEVTVGLFVDKRRWFRIEFGNRQMGWAFAGSLNVKAATRDEPAFALVLISDALASEGLPSAGLPGFGKWTLIVVALFFVIFGMIGKVMYDEMETSPESRLRDCLKLRKFVRALIAAPLALGAFLQAGNFSFQTEIAVVMFLCIAFQNGFFWQTLLPTDKLKPKPA